MASIAALGGLLLDLVRWLVGLKTKDAVQAATETDHAMLEDAASKPDRSQLLDELRHHKF